MSKLKFTENENANANNAVAVKPSFISHPEYYDYEASGSVWKTNAYDASLQALHNAKGIDYDDYEVVKPDPVSREDVVAVHTPEYADTVFGNPKKNSTAWYGGPWSPKAQKAVFRSAGGTIRNNEEALKRGVSVQLYDAFHHAYPNHGEGFCVLNDVAIAAVKAANNGKKVMIIDTDVHQGQGTVVCTQGNSNIYTISFHQENLYPMPKGKSSMDIGYEDGITDDVFLTKLSSSLNQAIQNFMPDLVMFVAGTDLYRGDKLSDTDISIDGIQQINKYILDFFGSKGIPVAMSVPQGYARDPKDTERLLQNAIKEAVAAHKKYYSNQKSSALKFQADLYHNILFTVVPKLYNFDRDITPELQNFSSKYVFLWDTWDEIKTFDASKWKALKVFLPKDVKFKELGKVGTTGYSLPKVPKEWPMEEVNTKPPYVQ